MRGDTLIEVLIALAVATVVISGITTLGISSLNNAKFIATQEQSSKYTQEGMEVVRKIRNGNYAGFAGYNNSGVYCLAKDATTLPASAVTSCTTANIDSTYIRWVQIIQNNGCGANFAHTTVVVAWTDGKCTDGSYCHNTRVSSCLSTVSLIQGP